MRIRRKRHEPAGVLDQDGVTESGVRYESGRDIQPSRTPRLVHMEQVDLSKVKRDFEIVEHLKKTHVDLYKTLKKEVRAANH